MRQDAFAAALLNPDLPMPEGVVDPQGRPAPKRFNVYRNNVTQGLGKALEAAFPAVMGLVGTDFFRAMALEFLRVHPPTGRIMMLYGADFAEFIAGFAPVKALGYLPDVARLEQAIRESYHSADAAAIAPAMLAGLPEARLLQARLLLAPSLRVLRSDWPVLSIRAATLFAGAAPQMRAEDVLITRPDFDPVVHVLPAGAADFIASLLAGARLIEALAETPQDFDLTAVLSLLIASKSIVGVKE